MNTELMHLSTEKLHLKGELDTVKKSARKLSQQLAEQEDLQAAKENDKVWALATVRTMRTKLKTAQRNMRLRKEYNEQLHKYAINHTAPAAPTAANGEEEASTSTASPHYPYPPAKKRKLEDPVLPCPRNVVSCTQCYTHGLDCSHDMPCQPCKENKKRCKRKHCATWDEGGNKCPNRNCFYAHPEDGYSNTVDMTEAKRDPGLPPVKVISRW